MMFMNLHIHLIILKIKYHVLSHVEIKDQQNMDIGIQLQGNGLKKKEMIR